MMSELDSLLPDFLSECYEHLDGIETLILQIEHSNGNTCEKQLNQVFRAAHSIKGGSSFFGFKKIQQLSHCLESLLHLLRSKILSPNSEITELLLKGFDLLRTLVNNAKESESFDISKIVEDLDSLSAKQKSSESSNAVPLAQLPDQTVDTASVPLDAAQKVLETPGTCSQLLQHDAQPISKNPAVEATASPSALLPEPVPPTETKGGSERLYVQNVEIPSEPVPPAKINVASEPADVETNFKRDKTIASDSDNAKEGEIAKPSPVVPVSEPFSDPPEATIRVKVNLLERLMNLAGELVLSRNQLREALSNSDMYAIQTSGQRINSVTSELQEAIMTTRLQAIDRIFSKVPRMVREVSRQVNKEISLRIEGNEVELDKSLIEGLSDPLTHLIRNSIDHGIETEEERIRLGKSIPAKIFLKARHEAGQVIIEVGDDGQGIDIEKVTRKAVSLGLVPKERVSRLSENEKMSFIFYPGFSTAEKITSLSGRGFGMDVVKTNIDRLGGKIEIETKSGEGSLFRIKLPLTLAIIPSLIIGAQKELFAIPQINVVELLRILAEQVKKRIEIIGGQEVLVLRGELLPLIELAAFLEIPKTYVNPENGEERRDRRSRLTDRRSPNFETSRQKPEAAEISSFPLRSEGRRFRSSGDVTILVVTTGVFSYGIIVDQTMYSEEIVVKPLGQYLKPLSEYSGATILGSGNIALIFDLAGLATRAKLVSISGKESASKNAQWEEIHNEVKLVPFLAFPCGGPERYALPLYMVLRIEKIRSEKIEHFGGWSTIPYGNRVLPVLSISNLLQAKPIQPDQEAVVIVTEIRGREIGILAAMPPEVVEIPLNFDSSVLRQMGIAGSRIEKGTTLLMVDLWEILQSTRPELLEFPDNHPLLGKYSPRVLLIEKQGYFRRQIRHFLEQSGYFVLDSTNLDEALRQLEGSSLPIQAIFADASLLFSEQFRLSKRIRAEKFGAAVPIIALSILGQEEVDQLRRNGINSLQIKLDHFGLLGCLSQSVIGIQAGFIQ
ncbi:MAG: chemotaxis protein CheW [Candidatus Ozemobacteraceae bacterium]